MKTLEEIQELQQIAKNWKYRQRTQYLGESYESGIEMALAWVQGQVNGNLIPSQFPQAHNSESFFTVEKVIRPKRSAGTTFALCMLGTIAAMVIFILGYSMYVLHQIQP